MVSASTARSGLDEYVVWDIPGSPCSLLLNLDLVDALKRLANAGFSGDGEINGILLGRTVSSDSSRTLVTIEDCHPIRERQHVPEHLQYWMTEEPGRLDAVGLVRGSGNSGGNDLAFYNTHFRGMAGVLLMIVPVRRGVPLCRMFWSGWGALDPEANYSEIPLDSARLKAGGFTILQGSPAAAGKPAPPAATVPEHRIFPAASRLIRRWAWVPLAAALLAVTSVTLWTAYRPIQSATAHAPDPAPIVIASDGIADRGVVPKTRLPNLEPAVVRERAPLRKPDPEPIAKPVPVPAKPVDPAPAISTSLPSATPPPLAPVPETTARATELIPPDTAPPAPPRRIERRSRPTPPEVSFEYRSPPESVARKLINRAPGLPLLRHFQTKEADDFVPPTPTRQPKPAVSAETARAFPGEWRVDLRVTVDRSGQIIRQALLTPNANPEFVDLARFALDHWEFEPARLHNRQVSSALDITFRFRNPVTHPTERAGR